MGSVLSIYQNQNTEPINSEVGEIDEFHDAIDHGPIDENIAIATVNMAANSKSQENLATDAVESKIPNIYLNTSHITYETVAEIEKDLSFYEKVSLVFLLYDHEDKALQSLLVEQANNKQGYTTNLLSDWANSKHITVSTWQDRFLEALCVIQNYALIRRLGFNKDELISRYLPTQSYTALHLDRVMKALYCLCEELSSQNVQIFIKYLAEDFRKKSLEFQDYGENYLEMYLLQCFSVKYIKKDDLSNLVAILKQMGMIQKAETLEDAVNSSSFLSNNVNLNRRNFDFTKPVENYENPTKPSCSKYSVVRDNSVCSADSNDDDCYKIDPQNVGICLIINEQEFYKEKISVPRGPCDINSLEELFNLGESINVNLEYRKGSEVDVASLSSVFTNLGFRIIKRDNLRSDEMIPTIKEEMRKFSSRDSCFVVCILSHGIKGRIFGANSKPVSIEKIEDALHDRQFDSLLGKPKLLIIQSCQGIETQKVYRPPEPDGLKTDSPSYEFSNLINDVAGVPQKCDLLVCMSTVQGFTSYRSENTGSWYIQELCKAIEAKCDKEHFLDILTSVNKNICSKRRLTEEGIFAMASEVSRMSLRFKLFLRKIKT